MRPPFGCCPLHLLFFIFALTGDAINPGCQCIRYRSTFSKEWGRFTSPDYPSSYSRGISCLLYSFQGPQDTIVQVKLESIHLPIYPNGCSSKGDFLKLFLHLEDDDIGVSEVTPWNSLLCGQKFNLTYFSASRQLIIQFHSSSNPNDEGLAQGFVGYFRFLNSSQYESNGRLVGGTKCDYIFESTNYSSPEGKFFSPNYPSTYPHNVMCAYLFHAKEKERVKITFESIDLEPGRYKTCLNKTDIIRVLDGPSTRSPPIVLLCNSVQQYEVVSTGPELVVQFIANSGNPGMGFRAKFHFIKVIYDNPYDPLRFNLQHYFPKTDNEKIPLGEDGQPQASTLVPKCDSIIQSDSGKNGTFTSPTYPHGYPPKSLCRTDFVGFGRQRVTISFVDFHLFHTAGLTDASPTPTRNQNQSQLNERKCGYSDTISAFVFLNGERRKILEYCGPHPPPNLMSPDHRMSLEFDAKGSTATSPSVRGFYAQYAFVEDFGDPTRHQLLDYPCAFVYNFSKSLNGSISSPNYPGLYPRDTECHYFFHGDETHYLQLLFEHLDIPGTNPCEEDFLEYSEYMPTDGRYSRLCGKRESNFILQSKSRFFRIGFRSSEGLGGGTGFQAAFTFTTEINQISIVNANSRIVVVGPMGVIMILTVHFLTQ